MESPIGNKIAIAERFLNFLEKRFVSTISTFVFSGALITVVFLTLVIPPLKTRIAELEEDNEYWKERYNNGPDEMLNFYWMLEEIKNGKVDNISIKEEYSKKLEEKTNELEQIKR